MKVHTSKRLTNEFGSYQYAILQKERQFVLVEQRFVVEQQDLEDDGTVWNSTPMHEFDSQAKAETYIESL